MVGMTLLAAGRPHSCVGMVTAMSGVAREVERVWWRVARRYS